MSFMKALLASLGTYTRLPVRFKRKPDIPPQQMLFYLIFSGVVLGVLWKLLCDGLSVLALPILVSAPVLLVFPYWFTGYLHLKAFMASSALAASSKLGFEAEESKESLAAISLAMLFVFGFAGIYRFVESGRSSVLLIFIPLLSRELTVLAVFLFPALSGNEYTSYKRSRKGENTLILMLIYIITVVLCITLTGMAGSVLIVVMLAAFLMGLLVLKSPFGITGETAGYALTLSETAGLFGLAILNF